jgi:hypothetical protein
MAIGVHGARQTTNYLEQADIAIPFIRLGSLLSLVAFAFTWFGKGMWRAGAVVVSALLFAWWLLIAISIY